jgi:putative inorganic carbon (hco3(-)) transporter
MMGSPERGASQVRTDPMLRCANPQPNYHGTNVSEQRERSESRLLGLNPLALWNGMRREPLSFWFLCVYVFVEYVRPQGIIPAIDVIPWGRTTLALTLLAFFLEGFKLRRFHLLDGLVVLFSGAWAASIVFAQYPDLSLERAYVFINWLLLYFLVTNIVTTRRRFFIFLIFFLLWSLKLSQHAARLWVMGGFHVPSWGVRGPQGWFQNPGEFGIQMVMFFPMGLLFAVGLRHHIPRWLFWVLLALLPGTAALSVLLTNARGSQLALVAVLLLLVAQTRHRVRGLAFAAVAMAALWAVVPDSQRDRFEVMGDDETSESRMFYLEHGWQITNEYPAFGIGYRNWIPYYNSRHDLLAQVPPGIPRGELPHNIYIEASAELGFFGLGALLVLMIGAFIINYRTRRLARAVPGWGPFLISTAAGLDAALLGFMISGFFVTVLYYPYLWTNLAFAGALFHVTRTSASEARLRARASRSAPVEPPSPGPHRVPVGTHHPFSPPLGARGPTRGR